MSPTSHGFQSLPEFLKAQQDARVGPSGKPRTKLATRAAVFLAVEPYVVRYGKATVGQKTIAAKAGVTQQTVSKALLDLRHAEVIVQRHQMNTGQPLLIERGRHWDAFKAQITAEEPEESDNVEVLLRMLAMFDRGQMPGDHAAKLLLLDVSRFSSSTLSERARRVGVAPSTVSKHMALLTAEGWIFPEATGGRGTRRYGVRRT